jgi:hypothetical protein
MAVRQLDDTLDDLRARATGLSAVGAGEVTGCPGGIGGDDDSLRMRRDL